VLEVDSTPLGAAALQQENARTAFRIVRRVQDTSRQEEYTLDNLVLVKLSEIYAVDCLKWGRLPKCKDPLQQAFDYDLTSIINSFDRKLNPGDVLVTAKQLTVPEIAAAVALLGYSWCPN
jgi:hypothetical protein